MFVEGLNLDCVILITDFYNNAKIGSNYFVMQHLLDIYVKRRNKEIIAVTFVWYHQMFLFVARK